MADVNNNDIWIDVETLAKLKNITRRAVGSSACTKSEQI